MDDDTPILVNQENNQLLLNAIKNKFSAQNSSDAASFSPPKFTIPVLKPQAAGATSNAVLTPPLKLLGGKQAVSSPVPSKPAMSTLNQFILGQLQGNSAASDNGFVLPSLNMINSPMKTTTTASSVSSHLFIPEFKMANSSNKEQDFKILRISQELHDLSVTEKCDVLASTIDLTTALSNTLPDLQSNGSNLSCHSRSKVEHIEDFVIPFIECDRKEQPTLIPTADECYQTDAPKLQLKHCLAAPSCFARITCLKFKCMHNLPRIDHSFKAKHNIQRFRFDTKSPDDIILTTLKKYQR